MMIRQPPSPAPTWHLFVPKLYTVLRQGYGPDNFRHDLIAGLTVAIVALPLAMALAIASGATPDKGLITAVIAGFLISALGGSRFSIGGPTGAFVVVVYHVISQYGYEGLLLATLMAGVMLILAGLAQFGTWIKYIPEPVVTGFTSGIAVIIFSTQIKEFLGLNIDKVPADFVDRLLAATVSSRSHRCIGVRFIACTDPDSAALCPQATRIPVRSDCRCTAGMAAEITRRHYRQSLWCYQCQPARTRPAGFFVATDEITVSQCIHHRISGWR